MLRGREREIISGVHPLEVMTVSTSGSLTLQSALTKISDMNEDIISTGSLESRISIVINSQENEGEERVNNYSNIVRRK